LKCFCVTDILCSNLDFSVFDNEFVHPLSSRVNVSGTLLQQTEALKLLLDACINIIFLPTTFRPKTAEIENVMYDADFYGALYAKKKTVQ